MHTSESAQRIHRSSAVDTASNDAKYSRPSCKEFLRRTADLAWIFVATLPSGKLQRTRTSLHTNHYRCSIQPQDRLITSCPELYMSQQSLKRPSSARFAFSCCCIAANAVFGSSLLFSLEAHSRLIGPLARSLRLRYGVRHLQRSWT